MYKKSGQKTPADEPSAIPKIVQLQNVMPTEKEKDTSIVMPSAEPEEGLTMEPSCNEDPGADSFAMPADVSLYH